MGLPDFVAIAKKYAPAIAIENKHHLNLVHAGRWISFDMRTADGLDYINGVGQAIKPVYDELQSARRRYDDDIKASIVVSNPSRIALYKALVGTIRDDVLNAQLSEVDCYGLLCYIYDKGPWPSDRWDIVCPDLAAAVKRLRTESDEQRDRNIRGALMKSKPSKVDRLADLLHGVNITELVQTCDVGMLVAFLEGQLDTDKEDDVMHELWAYVARDLSQCIILRRWTVTSLLEWLRGVLPTYCTQTMDSLTVASVYMAIRGNGEYKTGPKDLIMAVNAAKVEYQSKKQPTFTFQGEEKMSNELKIEYHSRLQCTEGNLSGTITLSINGELAIVDVACQQDVQKVSYNWVTMPKRGYDTAVQSMVCWFNGNAAAAIIVVVYPDGGMPKTIAVTLNI